MEFDFKKIQFKIVPKLRPLYENLYRKDHKESGDYFDNCVITRKTGDEFYDEMTLIHELLEYYLITKMGIKWEEIDKFDANLKYSRSRKYKDYRKAHRLCEKLEKEIRKLLNKNQ